MKNGKISYLKSLYRPPIKEWNEYDYYNLSNNQAPFGKYREYAYTYPLYKYLAHYYNVEIENILLTKGAEEGLRFCFDAFLEEGSEVLRPEPTFGLISFFEKLNKAKPITIDYDINRKLNEESLISKINEASMVYIASPDNPTGYEFSKIGDILNNTKKYNIPFILDLAYYDYGDNKFDLNIEKYPQLVRVHTFSKSHGTAGIRFGCLISSKDNIETLSKYRAIEEVNSIVAKNGVRILKSNILQKNLKQVKKWKKNFSKFKSYRETHTNFMIFDLDSKTQENLYNKLYNIEVLVRKDFSHPSMDRVFRIGIGKDSVMKKIYRIMENTL